MPSHTVENGQHHPTLLAPLLQLQEVRVLAHVTSARAFPPVKVDRSLKDCETLFAGVIPQMTLFANESKKRVKTNLVNMIVPVFEILREVVPLFLSGFLAMEKLTVFRLRKRCQKILKLLFHMS